MAEEMARVKRYSLGVPYLAYVYQYLGEYKETFRQVARTYGLWVLVFGWLGYYFP